MIIHIITPPDFADNTEAFTGEEKTPMEIVRSERKPSVSNGVISTLPIYRSAPPLEVRLEDFELYAIDRLRG